MRLIQTFFAGLAITFVFNNTYFSQAPETDFQIWNETTFVKPVLKTKDSKVKDVARLSLLFFGTLRLGQNRAFPVDKRVGTGFELRLNDSFTFTPTYLYRSANPGRNVKEYEHRIRFDITYQKKWKHVAIKNRDRVEYRVRNARADSIRFRNKFTFMVPVKKDGNEIFTPFISTEPYYDFSAKNWSSHELWAGVSRKLSKSVTAEFFYVRRDNRTGAPRHINGVGANFKIVLP